MGACCVGSCGKVLGGALAIAMIGIGAGIVQSQFQPVAVTLSEGTMPPSAANPAVSPPNPENPPSPENPTNPANAGDGQSVAPTAGGTGDTAPQNEQQPASVDPGTLGKVVTAAQAKALHSQGVIFIDARSAAEYEAGHIPAAFLLSMEAWDAPETKETLDFVVGFQKDPIVLYCTSPKCDASENLAILLEQAGFTRLHVMKEGLDAWTAAGYPVATGKE